MDWLINKYVGLLSSRLERYKKKGPHLYNFRCPLCGDSQKSKKTARGYIYEKSGKSWFHCHNCNKSMSTENFIKELDINLYNEYVFEKLKDTKTIKQIDFDSFNNKMKIPIYQSEGALKGLKKISQLNHNDPVKQYIVNRKIPNPYHAKLFYCPNFMHFVNTLIPNKFSPENLSKDSPRLIIPFLDSEKNLFAFQGRDFKNTGLRYITIVLDNTIPKVFGLDTVDRNKTIFVFEGPIDSMFIPNSIASAGGDITSVLNTFEKQNLVICYDNEPRSLHTIQKMNKAIVHGYNVCIWPESMQYTDINKMILGGLTIEYIQYIIKQNTFNGLMAKMSLSKYNKA